MTTTPNRTLPETEALVLSLDEYIRARYTLIAVQTYEEERFLRFMRALAQHERHRAKGLYVWSRPRGLRMIAGTGVGPEPRTIANREDPLSVIEYVEQDVESGLFVLCDFAPIYWITERPNLSLSGVCVSSPGRCAAVPSR